jgi:hypothetical protein
MQVECFQDLELGLMNLKLIMFLIQNQQDLNDFRTYYWEGKNKQFFAIQKYRMCKIKQRKVSLQNFSNAFAINPHNALEELFLQPIEDVVTDEILSKINKNQLSVTSIYNSFQEDLGMNVAQLSHSMRTI